MKLLLLLLALFVPLEGCASAGRLMLELPPIQVEFLAWSPDDSVSPLADVQSTLNEVALVVTD